MAMDNPPSEVVFPVENEDSPMSCWFLGVYYLSKPINCPLIRDCAAVHHGGAHSKQPKDATKKCWMILKVFPF